MAGREDEALVLSMMEELEVVRGREPETACTIYRVLPYIRREDPDAYDPKISSIGPFHCANEKLKSMEPIKSKFLRDLLNRSPHNSPNRYIDLVRSLEPQARKCYAEPVNLDSNTFVQMLVLDSCFIIEFLVKSVLDREDMELSTVAWYRPLIMNDLLLLENQIPFFVLESLFVNSVIPELRTLLENEEDVPATLTELVECVVKTGRIVYNGAVYNGAATAHHLLHLFHFWLSPTQLGTSERPLHLVESSPTPHMIPSAAKLSAMGVKFMKKKEANCLLDVTFAKGVMEIPLLAVQASTVPLFRNLVAFEQCCPASGSYFTSYVSLMGNLISKPSDVAILEGCGVIESKLGGDEAVARFFNSLGNGGYLVYEKHHFAGLFRDVKGFYVSRRRHRWRAMLMNDYFSNPWAIIYLVAALLLLLTMLRTYFVVFAYFRPPP